MEHSHVLTPKEAAEILRLNLETVRRMLREGQLPGRKVGARQWRIRLVDLENYLRPSSVPTDGQRVENVEGVSSNGGSPTAR